MSIKAMQTVCLIFMATPGRGELTPTHNIMAAPAAAAVSMARC